MIVKEYNILSIINEEVQNFLGQWLGNYKGNDYGVPVDIPIYMNPHSLAKINEKFSYTEIDEKLIGNNKGFLSSYSTKPIGGEEDYKYAEVYENPGTLKNFRGSCRAILDEDANLFVADNSNIIHVDFIEWLQQHGYLRPDQKWVYPTYVGMVALQQYMNTNILYLSESYKDIKNFKRQDILEHAKTKHPTLTFKDQLFER